MSNAVDKRDLQSVFRDRLKIVMKRFDGNQAEFADSIFLDRSALSQLLSGDVVRLPRAETLYTIADRHGINLDWLLGLDDDGQIDTLQTVEIESFKTISTGELLARWSREAQGHKIRYVPFAIPITYQTKEIAALESAKNERYRPGGPAETGGYSWFDKGLPDDIEMDICMPFQRLQIFAEGKGTWQNLDPEVRRFQIDFMADRLDEQYPSDRLYIFCEAEGFATPYVQYGPEHAVINTGSSRIIVNSRNHVRKLRADFDNLIRRAKVSPEASPDFLRNMTVT